MKKITELTAEQQQNLNTFYTAQLEVGRSCKPLDHSKVESIITNFYSRIGKAKPTFLYFASPMSCILAAEAIEMDKDYTKIDVTDINSVKVKSDVVEMMLANRFGGQQWISWSSFYDFLRTIGVEYDPKDSELLSEWVEEGKHLHWWFPFDDVVFISERPVSLTVNETGNLHNETGMAIEYSDGWGMYVLNGITVPKYLVVTESEQLDLEFYKNEKNADVKAEFVRKFGVERMLDFGKKIDSYENYDQEEQSWWWKSEYELWDMASIFDGIEYQPYLKMKNQTTGIWHVEALSPACRTLTDAIKERFNGKEMKIVNIS